MANSQEAVRGLLKEGYLSHNQWSTWNKSPQKYIDEYIHGKPNYRTPEMLFGIKFAEDYENNQSDDETIEWALAIVKHYPIKEHEMRVEVDDFELMGRLDGFNDLFEEIGDFKTSSKPWTQRMADESTQLTFYSLMHWLIKGTIPKLAIHNLPTDNSVRSDIQLTGEYLVFETTRTQEQLEQMLESIKRTVAEIRNWKDYQKNIVKI